MNKKEKQQFDDAILNAQTVSALRWSEPVEKDLQIPTSDNFTHGYLFNTSYFRIYEASSSSIYNWQGHQVSGSFTRSQNPIELFSTKLLALKALRYSVEMEAAKKLLAVDKMIAGFKGDKQ